ncbi:uncharacterized protein LOC130734666 isoform X2 [Lotus japonicus]|uniref:uncharacterized protein LOC130734666 isoform X2 n=1 Tax=Lotus japonicus TaxID=34305 RepID=UPI0025843C24|nr:uncharacterized protein LOC130734666 isoform X2 [Lotus japonicus]
MYFSVPYACTENDNSDRGFFELFCLFASLILVFSVFILVVVSRFYQPPTLPALISDLNAKMEAMITILEGGTQDHVHHKWKEDLIEMLEELGQSYRVLFISYNQLKSKTSSNVVLIGPKKAGSNKCGSFSSYTCFLAW